MSEEADVLLLCGDLTDYGLPEEAQILAHEIQIGCTIPIVGVLGNHDYESGRCEEVRKILLDAGVTMLDGDACEIGGCGFVGVKGFCGGFGKRTVEPWGEKALKSFVHTTVEEAIKLEKALMRQTSATCVALMHYSPIQATVEGEPLEIYPFLGSSRLEEPLAKRDVAAVFHGHAHKGSLEGRTSSGIPVYNVAMPLLRRVAPGGQPYRVVTVEIGARLADA
jgi:Icc-related predicted phosphoesterase